MTEVFDPVRALENRVRSDGAQPLLTCYDLQDGSRVEFSARTLANWVDKTANLLGALGADEGCDVGLPLLLSHPGHWVGLVWSLATWQVGGRVVALPREMLDRVEIAVVGPQNRHPVPGVETVVCSLHPLGAGLQGEKPGITDYAEVLAQPDVHWRNDSPQTWVDDGSRRITDADLSVIEPSASRRLLRPSGDPCEDLTMLLLQALRGGGSSVIVRGDGDEDAMVRMARAERAERR